MSKLQQLNGDDHPAAAGKHLLDAQTLLVQRRADGAAYLSGYVVECALKSLLLHEKAWQSGDPLPWKKGAPGHKLNDLQSDLATLASLSGSKTARYFKSATSAVSASAVAAWNPEMRYRAETIAFDDARAWCETAESVYSETIEEMEKDGLL